MGTVVLDDTGVGSTAVEELIDSETAERYLAGNVRNRKLKEGTVAFYADEMTKGRWHWTADPIQFAEDGTLLNGQHRLEAIVRAGITIRMLVVRGLDHEAQAYMDGGAKRTAGDVLDMLGTTHASNVAAVARLAILVARTQSSTGANLKAKVSTGEIMEWVEANPEIHEIQALARRVYKATDAPSQAAFTYSLWRMAAVDQHEAEQFAEALANKVGLKHGDPVLALIRKFQDIRRENRRVPVFTQVSVLLRAWNARRKGEEVQKFYEVSDGGKPIAIPTQVI